MANKKEKWRVVDYMADKGRYVISQDNVLIADCYADTKESLGLPANYHQLAKRIALLPQMEKALRDVYAAIPWGHPARNKAVGLLDKLDKLRPT